VPCPGKELVEKSREVVVTQWTWCKKEVFFGFVELNLCLDSVMMECLVEIYH
jgi:hypothetical protein